MHFITFVTIYTDTSHAAHKKIVKELKIQIVQVKEMYLNKECRHPYMKELHQSSILSVR